MADIFEDLKAGSSFARSKRRHPELARCFDRAAAPAASGDARASVVAPLDFFGLGAAAPERDPAASRGGPSGAAPPGDDDSEPDDDAAEPADDAESEAVRLFERRPQSDERPRPAKPDAARSARQRTEEIAAFRRRMLIHASGERVPDPIATFGELRFRPRDDRLRATLLRNIEASQWTEPSPVQMQAIPTLLEGRDTVVCAPTGSGKTAAFVIPALARAAAAGAGAGVRALLLAPTRELRMATLGAHE